MSCPKCGGNLKSEVIGSSAIQTCQGCGWSVATSYVDPIYEDDTVYRLYIEDGNVSSRPVLTALSKVLGCNYLGAKKAVEGGRSLLFEGDAVKTREKRDALDSGGVVYAIEPYFPY